MGAHEGVLQGDLRREVTVSDRVFLHRLEGMNDPAASSVVSSSLLRCHSVLDTESSRVFWIPAFAGMTNSPQAAGNTTLRQFNKEGEEEAAGFRIRKSL